MFKRLGMVVVLAITGLPWLGAQQEASDVHWQIRREATENSQILHPSICSPTATVHVQPARPI